MTTTYVIRSPSRTRSFDDSVRRRALMRSTLVRRMDFEGMLNCRLTHLFPERTPNLFNKIEYTLVTDLMTV